MAAELDKLLSSVSLDELQKVAVTEAEQLTIKREIFKLSRKRLRQLLTILQKVEPDHVDISAAGVQIDIKKLTIFTQRHIQKFLVNAAKNPCPSRKSPDDTDTKEDDATTETSKEFKGVKMAAGIRDVGSDVGLVGGKKKDTKPKAKSPYHKEIDEYVEAIETARGKASAEYWTILAQELQAGNLTRAFRLLSEVVQRTKKLVPEAQHANIDDKIDVKLIQTAAENGAMDGELFMAMFDSIHDTLRGLHPPAMDAMWDAWRQSIVELIGTGITWHELLPQMINKFLIKLDQLEFQIKSMRRAVGLPDKPQNSVENATKT